MSQIPGLRAVSIRPNEILVNNVAITLESARPMDTDVVRKSLGVEGVDGAVRTYNAGKRAIWTPRAPMRPGRYQFQISDVLAKSGSLLSSGGVIPFTVARSAGRIPSAVAIESMVRFRIERNGTHSLPLFEEATGKYVELLKGENRRKNVPVALAFDQSGRAVDAERLLAEAEVTRARTYGKLHEELYRAMREGRPNERMPVAIWLWTDPQLLDRTRPTRAVRRKPRSLEPAQRAIEQAVKRGTAVLSRLKARTIRISRTAPVIFARLTRDEVKALAADKSVSALFLYDPEGIEDLVDSMAIANSDDVHALGIRGSGIRVAVWEDGPDSTTNLSIAGRFQTNPDTSDHSRHVHGIIRNIQTGAARGHARSCRLFSANDKDLDALDWAVEDQECTVINQSFHRSAEPRNGTLSFDDVYKDWLALRWPYPTICLAAGNYWAGDDDDIDPPSDEYVNHKGFNSLAVGNHNDDASDMSSSSVFRNPTSTHGDRELPEIAANGTSVTAVGLTKSGTSMASPAAAGVAALLQDTNGTLQHWPEGCRAILLAGATRNVVDSTWWLDVSANVDASDGSGAVNALESHQIALSRRSRNASATRRGWNVGSLQSADFNGSGLSTFDYKVKVPIGILGPRKVKVALAWTSKVSTFSILGFTIPLTSKLTVDLDLKVFDSAGNQVGYSGSYDNSYEIAEFVGNPGQEYTIRIRRWSGTDRVFYGIAWTVTGGIDLSTVVPVANGRAIAIRTRPDD